MRPPNSITKNLILERCNVTADCWNWIGTITNGGYGQVVVKQKRFLAHRMAKHIWHGFNLNSKLLVCHKCDNPSCVNPDHLFIGDHSANNKDARDKNRWIPLRGDLAPWRKIDSSDVLLMDVLYATGWTQREISAIFPVSRRTISQILARRTWSTIPKFNEGQV